LRTPSGSGQANIQEEVTKLECEKAGLEHLVLQRLFGKKSRKKTLTTRGITQRPAAVRSKWSEALERTFSSSPTTGYHAHDTADTGDGRP
jgi:hypothetical protein